MKEVRRKYSAMDAAVGAEPGAVSQTGEVFVLAHLCALEHGAIGRAPQPD